jgi:hypothetical protein
VTAHECIASCIASVDACTASIQAATERLRWVTMNSMLGIEPILPRRLPKWKRLRALQRLELETGDIIEFATSRTVRSEYLRRDYLERDVVYLRQLVVMPYFIAEGSAEAAYKRGHVRTMKR